MRPLAPLPVAVPLLAAALLMATTHRMHRRTADALAIAAGAATAGLCGILAVATARAPLVYWLGGWRPEAGVEVGISFFIDPGGAGLAALGATVLTAGFVFSWRYFDAPGTLFHVLMLLLLAGVCGFCLSGDLFDLFVFLELASIPAYALTGFKIEDPGPLQGAINFAVANTIAAMLVLTAIGLLYARTGALNLAAIGAALGGRPPDALVLASLALLLAGLFTKAALPPFQLWVADAYAVAPIPVAAAFAAVLTELGLYGVARIYWSVFAAPLAGHASEVRAILLGFAAAAVVVGGLMAFAQRHLKRMLAFATVAHAGLMLAGIALLDGAGLAGAGLYAVGHGLIMAALFMATGTLLHRFSTVDELDLRGRGARIPAAGLVYLAGGLALAGLPPFGTWTGAARIEEAATAAGLHWVPWLVRFASAVTGAAVLRAAGRVFLGLGSRGEAAAEAPSGGKEERETSGWRNRLPGVMVGAALALTLAALAAGIVPAFTSGAERAATRFADPAAYVAATFGNGAGEGAADVRALAGSAPQRGGGGGGREAAVRAARPPAGGDAGSGSAPAVLPSLLTSLAAVLLALLALYQDRIPGGARRLIGWVLGGPMAALRAMHSGLVGDNALWVAIGAALLVALTAVVLS